MDAVQVLQGSLRGGSLPPGALEKSYVAKHENWSSIAQQKKCDLVRRAGGVQRRWPDVWIFVYRLFEVLLASYSGNRC